MIDADIDAGVAAVLQAVEGSGRPFRVGNGQINTRCPFCGDSSKSAYSRHFYVALQHPHMFYCQRCGARGGAVTVEVLEGLGADEGDAVAYARAISKEQRRGGPRRRRGPRLGVSARDRSTIPPPSRDDPCDAAAIGYLEGRLGGALTEEEVQRYKIVACGLYGFLQANGLAEERDLTVPLREADRINDTCVGFLSADETYIVFRSLDEEWVKRRGLRYTNYRVYHSHEGSKVFACRADVDLLAPSHTVVLAEGVIDLMGVERAHYPRRRWDPDFVGAANCGSSHADTLRMLMGLGIIEAQAEVHLDSEPGDQPAKLRRALASSPFFSTPRLGVRAYQNSHPGEKDFGVPPEKIRRVRAVL